MEPTASLQCKLKFVLQKFCVIAWGQRHAYHAAGVSINARSSF